jgi:hypothetical protein
MKNYQAILTVIIGGLISYGILNGSIQSVIKMDVVAEIVIFICGLINVGIGILSINYTKLVKSLN